MARKKYEKNKELVSEDIDYSKLIFWQIDRILKAITEYNENCIIGVDALEIALTHHHDDIFFEELQEIDDWYKKQANKVQVMGRISTRDHDQLNFLKAKKKFRAIMRLIDRIGMFPEKETEQYG